VNGADSALYSIWRHSILRGSDRTRDIRDTWSPCGTGDLLERAAIIRSKGDFRRDDQIETAFDLVSAAGARALGIADYGIAVGGAATLFTIPASGVPEAVAAHPRANWYCSTAGSSPAAVPCCRPRRQPTQWKELPFETLLLITCLPMKSTLWMARIGLYTWAVTRCAFPRRCHTVIVHVLTQ
jgi:hypothetical protein